MIRWFLEKKEERLRYPDSYYTSQMEKAEKILEMFRDINIDIKGEKSLQVRLENKNTVSIRPLEGSSIINPKKKFKKGLHTLIIRPGSSLGGFFILPLL